MYSLERTKKKRRRGDDLNDDGSIDTHDFEDDASFEEGWNHKEGEGKDSNGNKRREWKITNNGTSNI